ncbi:MAG: hypothetical protein INQ03_13735 [Candidatus Heimdallarchaeota archaeon]|nr:hypothetical protein [Candidatus Heimdallarchaeota archaeon]
MSDLEQLYTINVGKHKFTLRPEEKAGLKRRLDEDEKLKYMISKDRNDRLFASLEYAIKYQSNSIIQAFGIPESGKSTILKIIIFHLYNLLKEKNKMPEIELTYNYVDTIHKISEYGKSLQNSEGRFVKTDRILIIFQDEQTKLQGNESKSYETQLNNLLENFRAMQIFVFLASPNIKKIAVCNTYIEAIAKDIDNRTNWGLWLVPKRVKDNIKYEVDGTILLEYTSEIEEFFNYYEDQKMNNILDLISNRGLQAVRIPDEVLNDAVELVIKEAKKRKLNSKEQVRTLTSLLGVGTANTTKAVAELATLEYEAYLNEIKEKERQEEERRKILAREEEERRINNLVVSVAKRLYEEYNFEDKKSFSRIVAGWLIENYPDDWQRLIKQKSYIWSLAEYWQDKTSSNEPTFEKVNLESTDRVLLRKAFMNCLEIRREKDTFCLRFPFYFIWDEQYTKSAWSVQKATHALNNEYKSHRLKYGAFRAYCNKNAHHIKRIEENNKIWGDAGELYLKYKILKVWKDLQFQGFETSKLTLDLLCGAEKRSDEGNTSIFDIEVIIEGESACAINVKFVYLDNQSFAMSPENTHERPYLFVIDKNTLNEFLIPSEKGKAYQRVNASDQALTIDNMLIEFIQRFQPAILK